MVDYDITFEGTTLEAVFDVNYNAGTATEIGTCNIKCANTDHNRAIESGDEVVVRKNGEVDYQGYVMGKPTQGGAEKTDLDLKLSDKRVQLKQERVERVFHNRDSGEIVKAVIDGKSEVIGERYGFSGDDTSNWEADAPFLELGEITSKQLYEYGDDFIFVGWREGATGEKVVTRKNVNTDIQPGENNRVDKFKTRMKINDTGELFEAEIAYRDGDGNEYVWDIEVGSLDRGFTLYELPVEEAGSDAGDIDENTVEYRFTINGTLPEKRAVGIDYFSSIPYQVNDRDTAFDTSGVQDTDRNITRRFNKDALSIIHELSVEDSFISYIDENDVLYYEPQGSRTTPRSIDYDTTPITEANFERDYTRITNKVTVQGADDVKVTESDTASINFYGVSSRDEAIIDKEIQTEEEARERAQGYLKKHAWDDIAIEFEVADADYQDVMVGDEMQVDWPPENVNDTYTVKKKSSDSDGFVTLGLTKAT